MLAEDGNNLDLDCGISYERIAAWLDGELSLPHEQDCWIYDVDGEACQITLEPLETRTLGIIKLERSHLVASGDSNALETFERLFTLRFISAGG